MTYYSVRREGNSLVMDGTEIGQQIRGLDGHKAKRIGDLDLHAYDFEFTQECLNQIGRLSADAWAAREALWRTAVVTFMKCFGSSGSRGALSSDQIYKPLHRNAVASFEYFKDLRNKHLVHDQNAWTQALVAVVVNPDDNPVKVADVRSMLINANTLADQSVVSLQQLTQAALEFVRKKSDELRTELIEELEQEDRAALLSRPEMSYKVPENGEIAQPRSVYTKPKHSSFVKK